MPQNLKNPKSSNIAGNYYPKYETKNPIAKLLMKGFMNSFDALSSSINAKTAFDAGCGEGELSFRLMNNGIKASGIDIENDMVVLANSRAQGKGLGEVFKVGSVTEIKPGSLSGVDLLVCCEVMEHVDDPDMALTALSKSGATNLLISVPREPIWRFLNLARFKYISDLGNTPGHINHWGTSEFISYLETQLTISSVRTPLPWTMVLATPK